MAIHGQRYGIQIQSIGDMASGMQNWPVLCMPPGGKSIYGSWNDEILDEIFYINITDASNPSGYEGQIYRYDTSGWDYNRNTFTIAAYDAKRFAVGHVGHIIYAGYDLPSSCQITWFTNGFSGNSGITGDEDYPIGYMKLQLQQIYSGWYGISQMKQL